MDIIYLKLFFCFRNNTHHLQYPGTVEYLLKGVIALCALGCAGESPDCGVHESFDVQVIHYNIIGVRDKLRWCTATDFRRMLYYNMYYIHGLSYCDGIEELN